ncbi:signal peptidase I [Microbacterium nanhaiense]|nr:signal peptidase I [Microbacterium nanhaiense]
MTTEAGSSPSPERSRGRGFLTFLRDVVVIVVVAVLVSVLIKTFVVRSFYIPSESMENTLLVDDKILVDELTPKFGGYHRGDVIVFADPGGWLDGASAPQPGGVTGAIDWALSAVGLSASDSDEHLVKRLIGLPGDHITCCNELGQLVINGAGIDESDYLRLPAGSSLASKVDFDVVVPDGMVWVMGDNRNNSRDSRFHNTQPGGGFVPIDDIVGRVALRTWPLSTFGPLENQTSVFRGVPEGTGE